MNALKTEIERLNAEQREAVEHLYGPLLVIAGPGTGKTQLLSVRAANILASTDARASDILCLTFSRAGAEAMRKRLIELIGKEAYGIEVNTFHGFASKLRSDYPQYFKFSALERNISDFERSRLINSLLNALPPSNPLYASKRDGLNNNYRNLTSFITTFKRSGLTPDEFRAIQRQTIDTCRYLLEHPGFSENVSAKIPGKRTEKEEHVDAFVAMLDDAYVNAPAGLKKPLISTAGTYSPYLEWFHELCTTNDLYDTKDAFSYANMRNAIFESTDDGGKAFKASKQAERALAAIDLYDAYERHLEDALLYDYDDMIIDAVNALEANPSLRRDLQDRYTFIQVDEFQDTNGAQMRLLELLLEGVESPNLMAVGDDDQAIMRFQGATIACIEDFQRKYHPHEVVLTVNYRSTQPIVDLGNSIAAQIESRLTSSVEGKRIVAFQDEIFQDRFEDRLFAEQSAELFALAEDIRKRMDAGFIANAKDPDEAIAVIAPKHKQLQALMPYLNHFDIPYAYVFTANALQMESMQTLLAMMRFSVLYGQGRVAEAEAELPRILASAELGLSNETCIAFTLFAKREHHGRWFEALEKFENTRTKQLYDDLLEWSVASASRPVRQLIHRMSKRLAAYYLSIKDDDPFAFAEFNSGIRALLDFIETEQATAVSSDRALGLAGVVESLEDAKRLNIKIEAAIKLGNTGAVRLLTAHGSKGLEYDLVYVLNADNDSWYKSSPSQSYITDNLFIGTTKDDDDVRRLLFVATTRAKKFLEFYSAKEPLVRELQDLIEMEQTEESPDTLALEMEIDWQQNYRLDTPELRRMLELDLSGLKLSVSALNDLVEYKEDSLDGSVFLHNRMIRLPHAPNESTEFGTLVHAFMEDYLNQVIPGTTTLADLTARYENEIAWLDFPQETTDVLLERFERIVDAFVPELTSIVGDRYASEATLSILLDDEVPLYGKCDLLVIDDAAKSIRIVDFKTGFSRETGRPSTSYERQLQFYKLLVENSEQYRGYTVVESVDLYVEPDKGTNGQLADPLVSNPSAQELKHLVELIKAAWHRIQAGDFDMSGFEGSEQKAEALANNLKADGTPKKTIEHRTIQAAFETWLIEEDR